MDKNIPTKLTLEHCGNKMTWEGSWDAGIDDIMDGFIGCLRGIGFGDWIIESVKNWCTERLPEKPEDMIN